MKRVVRASLALSAALLLFVGALGAEIRQLTAVPSPESGQTSSGTRRALVVLDLQEDYTGTAARPPLALAVSTKLPAPRLARDGFPAQPARATAQVRAR